MAPLHVIKQWPMYDSAPIPLLTVRTDDGRVFRFSRPFHVGRSADCDVQVDDTHVSRRHLRISCEDGRWSFTDLHSSNGVYVDGRRGETGPLEYVRSLRLGGLDGPSLAIDIEQLDAPTIVVRLPAGGHVPPEGSETTVIATYADKYFRAGSGDEPAGPRTMFIRKAFQEVQKKQKRRHLWVVVALATVALSAAAYAGYAHVQMRKMQTLAEGIFYSIKEQDVALAYLEVTYGTANTSEHQAKVRASHESRRAQEQQYDQLLEKMNYGQELGEEDKLILRVTRLFGECELIAPREYLAEVKRFIRMWRSTQRFERAVRLAQEKGYIEKIAAELIAQDLPPQYFYLAMQESNFEPSATGPPTRYGYAKGMWQFIPETGERYGLKSGPRVKLPGPDPADERTDWEKATRAAARYIKYIYATDAQASGLLVMASYNWGEHRIIDRISKMPSNPRGRNFWKLLAQHRIPDETYNYVFSIVSAAVIGENPRLFGFEFDNPLDPDRLRLQSRDAVNTAQVVGVNGWP